MGSRRPDGRNGSRRPPAAGRRTPRGRSRPSAGPDEKRGPSEQPERAEQAAPGEGSDERLGERPAQPEPSRRRSGLTGRAAILALVLAALIVSYASSLRAWVDQRTRISDMQTEVAQREKRVEELEKELGRWKDPAYVQTQARERFGWVMPGEIGYVVVGDDGKTPQGQAAEGEKKASPPPWYRTLWGSVEHAGKPPKEAAPKPRVEPADKIEPK